MNVKTSQVVRSPDDPWNEEIVAKLKEYIHRNPIDRKTKAKLVLGWLIHPFTHTWVRHKRYDDASDRIIDVGIVCYYCPTGKRQ